MTIAARHGTTAKWEMALLYGLRQGERLGLRWKDFTLDTAEPFMTVQNQLQRQTGKGLVLLPVKTSHSARQIPLLDSTVEALRTLLQVENLRAATAGRIVSEEDFVFTSAVGGPIDCANDRKEWMALLNEAKVTYRKGHAARHTAATLIGDLNQASKLLGHSSIQVTADFYAGVPQASMRKALQGMKDDVENLGSR
jgi:integrase